ncbi:MAG: response regulator transcription factor [Gemmatimonadetes bacterium]|jgi:DNA-binding response OmpR family regulator|nr:response regulator transcription factor [Gemmatimonadota bacterium]MBT5060645.1 response regulator transcription factor [Gemmatimonadota bacterium]MBT5141595.1 response regulator transcription factor [Gemmatimonadota bacterium]MBT5590898.1 response regulator transcription factor [Gemmatimonadota bacterium]MBT5965038.1 response regulator transcription factor [Gemmatimonadota bacterium]
MPKILVVEDERPISKVIVDNLAFEGFEAIAAFDGPSGLEMAMNDEPDLVLLDIMMPGMNGYDVCRALRQAGRDTPVIMLSARGEEVDKVLGLELGADDYITKPVGVRELMARVRAVLRRAPGSAVPQTESSPRPLDSKLVLQFGTVSVDFETYETVVGGNVIHLSPKAFGVLRLLWSRAGKAVSRADILQQVWGYDALPTTRTVDNHVAELRAAVEQDSGQPQHLLTVHGVGYRLVDVPAPPADMTET